MTTPGSILPFVEDLYDGCAKCCACGRVLPFIAVPGRAYICDECADGWE